jgi:hypothetical protein
MSPQLHGWDIHAVSFAAPKPECVTPVTAVTEVRFRWRLRQAEQGPAACPKDVNAASIARTVPGQDVRPRWHDARMTRKAHYDHAALAKALDDQLYVITRAQALADVASAVRSVHRGELRACCGDTASSVTLADARVPGRSPAGDRGHPLRGRWQHDHRGRGAVAPRNPSSVSDVVDVLIPTARKLQSTGFARVWRTTRLPARPWMVAASGSRRLRVRWRTRR